MTIQQILTRIQNERYGEDVRQAIIDGLQLCYDERAVGGYCPVEDLNTYYSGAAFCTSDIAHGPFQSSFVVICAGDSDNCFQVAINALNINDGYTRKKRNGSWTSWQKLGISKTIRYWNQDGTELLYTESVTSGSNGTWSGAPTKDPTVQYEYTFVGWSTSMNSTAAEANATKNITANRDVYAAFSASLRSYSVYFYNDSTLLKTEAVQYGSNATGSGITAPTKASTAQYDYTFAGWNSQNDQSSAESGVLNNITGDKIVYAAFSSTVRSYYVYFYNASTLLFTDTVEYGSDASFEGNTPTKASSAQYSYTFSGWNANSYATSADANALKNITANRTVYAMFRATIRTYTVRFMNGTTVLQSTTAPYGSTVTYTGATPVHPTAPDEYTFIGFEPDGTNITGDTDCQAVYILNPKELRYWNYNGTELLNTELVEFGGDGVWNGTSSRASTAEHSYIFLGWSTSMNASVADVNATKNLTADRDVYAAFEETIRSYSVRFYNGSTLLYTDLVQYGENAAYSGSTPTKDSTVQYEYAFVGWNSQDEQSSAESGILNNITTDKDVYAAFSAQLIACNVYFYNGTTLLGSVLVQYGSDASDSGIATPVKDSTPQYDYTFVGWNTQDGQTSAEVGVLSNITSDKTVYAAFSSSLRSYNVYFYNGSTLLDTVSVQYGSNAVYSGSTPTKDSTIQYEYTFVGWNSQNGQSSAEVNVLNNITADKTVYAAYSEALRSYTVSFYVYAGSSLLGSVSVPYGSDASDSTITAPAKMSTAQYDYAFVGWNTQSGQTSAESGVLSNITADKTVYAAYSETIRSYNVYFYNGSTLLDTVSVQYGSDAVYSGELPSRESSDLYEYTFVGWNSQDEQSAAESGILENITGNRIVYAAFETVDATVYIYGIKREYGITDPAWTRTDYSSGSTAVATYGSTPGHSDFDTLPIYKDIKRVTLDSGDVMVQIPRFYFQRYLETDENDIQYENIRISRVPQPGFMIHPAFLHNGVVQDYIYVGAYLSSVSNSAIWSKTGQSPVIIPGSTDASKKISYYRDLAGAKGTGWSEYDVSTNSAIQMLYLIEYATNDSQAAIGKGNCNIPYPYTLSMTGGCDDIYNLTGGPINNDYTKQVVYRGIEDLWGNGGAVVDGIQVRSGSNLYISNNQSRYSTSANAGGYSALSYQVLNTGSWCVLKMGLDPNNPAYMFAIEKAASSSETGGYCDSQAIGSSSSYPYSYILCGGWQQLERNGIFYNVYSASASDNVTLANTASRLLYVPQTADAQYQVRFYNGSELLQDRVVQNGETAVYFGDTPTKESTSSYDYTFIGWNTQDGQSVAESGVLENITGNKVVYAAFSSSTKLI